MYRLNERWRKYRLLKPGFKSDSDITDKRLSIIESIFGELYIDEDIIFSEEYSSSDESDESLSRGNKKPKAKIQFRIAGISESVCNREWEESILIIRYACIWWILWFIYSKKILVDHINYNKNHILITLKEISANTLK